MSGDNEDKTGPSVGEDVKPVGEVGEEPSSQVRSTRGDDARNRRGTKEQGKDGKGKYAGFVGRDYEALYQEWKVSGVPRAEWLKRRGINGRSGSAYTRTKRWDLRLRAESAGIRDTVVAQSIAADVAAPRVAENVDNVVQMPTPPGRDEGGEAAPKASEPAVWQIVNQWRRKQALEDWKTADLVRHHVRVMLRDALRTVSRDGRDVLETKLKPHELRQLMQALADVQRVQRLALGLSTENVGVDPLPAVASNIEKNVTPDEEPIPTFEVRMSSRGRFLRPRPQRIS